MSSRANPELVEGAVERSQEGWISRQARNDKRLISSSPLFLSLPQNFLPRRWRGRSGCSLPSNEA